MANPLSFIIPTYQSFQTQSPMINDLSILIAEKNTSNRKVPLKIGGGCAMMDVSHPVDWRLAIEGFF